MSPNNNGLPFDLGFLGGGRMASAIRTGLLKSMPPGRICVYEPEAAAAEAWRGLGCAALGSEAELFRSCQWLVWAVKPQVFHRNISAWEKLRFKGSGWVSIMAGVRLEKLEALSGGAAVIRAMPNTPLLVGEGMTALCPGENADSGDLAEAAGIFGPVSRTVIVDESAMDGVTALSGSGPAYLFLLAEAVERHAQALGLAAEKARELFAQTLVGAGRMLLLSGKSPAELRGQVTSPGGTTEAALELLAREDLAGIFGRALLKAKQRSSELSR